MHTRSHITPQWRHTLRRHARRFRIIFAGTVLLSQVIGCKDTLSNSSIPDGMLSPSVYLSKAGALALTKTATDLFRVTAREFILYSGLLTDELGTVAPGNVSSSLDIDSRRIDYRNTEAFASVYRWAHQLRGQSRLARGVLAEYAPDVSPAIRGQLYAFEGFAELWLADLFCSGVPLSTVDFEADITHRPPSTTQEVYEHAAALFDSALALAADSANVQTLAAVGKGRALLAIGRYEEAAAAVATVSVSEVFTIRTVFLGIGTPMVQIGVVRVASVSDREGENGIAYRTGNDPRTRSDTVTWPCSNDYDCLTVYWPRTWSAKDYSVVAIASGIEAALIGAEAALKREQPAVWLSMLNTLRTTGAYSRIDTSTAGEIDTLWNAGSGGVAGLRPLEDPVDANLRVNLMFAERAAWLFLSGHRQGDLRRLIREYGRTTHNVYPTGTYRDGEAPGYSEYGDEVTALIPNSEKQNPYFRGCLSRDA